VKKEYFWKIPENTLGYEDIYYFNKIRLSDGRFKIFFVGEESIILAAAILDPESDKLQILWNFDISTDEMDFPTVSEDIKSWIDDMTNMPNDNKYKVE